MIYHLEERYTEALLHYNYASQLDSGGKHARLINENMDKLRRQRQIVFAAAQAHQQSVSSNNQSLRSKEASVGQQQKCQSRAKALRSSQSPNTTFDHPAKRSSYMANSANTAAIEGAFQSATSGLFSMHTSILFSF